MGFHTLHDNIGRRLRGTLLGTHDDDLTRYWTWVLDAFDTDCRPLAGTTYAPDRVIVSLHPDDAETHRPLLSRFRANLLARLQEHIDRRNLTLTAPGLRVRIHVSSQVAPGTIEVETLYARDDDEVLVEAELEIEIDEDPDAEVTQITGGNAPTHADGAVFETLGSQGAHHVLGDGNHLVGRAASCDIRLPATDDLCSRRHLRLIVGEGTVGIDDLDSGNGTYLNGNRIDQAELDVGDVIRVGSSSLRLVRIPA